MARFGLGENELRLTATPAVGVVSCNRVIQLFKPVPRFRSIAQRALAAVDESYHPDFRAYG
jgi:hypothetical protein